MVKIRAPKLFEQSDQLLGCNSYRFQIHEKIVKIFNNFNYFLSFIYLFFKISDEA